MWVHVDVIYSHSKLSHLYHIAITSLFKPLPPPTTPLSPPPYIRWLNINEFHEESSRTDENQPYLIASLVVQKLIDNKVLLCSVNESNTKTSLRLLLLNEFLKWDFSKYWLVASAK